jgi:hypothetical protein
MSSTVGCMVSCRAHSLPLLCSLPGYSLQVCIRRLPYIDHVGCTGLAFSSHPTYLPATYAAADVMLYTCHHSETQPMDYFRVATGRRKSSPSRGALADISCCLLLSACTGNLLDSDMSECLHMLQPSLLSGPERFALGGGRSGSFFVLSVSYVSQHCSIVQSMWCLHMLLVDSSMHGGTCSPACMYKSSLNSSFICKLWPHCTWRAG